MSFSHTVVVMPGSTPIGLPLVRTIADDFGWKVDVAFGLDEVSKLRGNSKPLAVLCQEDSLGAGRPWPETVRLFKSAVPDFRLIACHGFADGFDWPAIARAGTFHAFWLPLNECEVRQGFGFIWADERRVAGDSHLIDLPAAPLIPAAPLSCAKVQLIRRAAG